MLLFIGMILVIVGMFKLVMKLRLRKYSCVKAEVVDLSFYEYERGEVYVRIKYFLPKANYSYIVDNKKYTSEIVFPDHKYLLHKDKVGVTNFISKIKKSGFVFYDPFNEQDSILYMPSKIQIWMKDGSLLLTGIALSVVHLLLFM